MCNRIFELLELHVDSVVNALVDESAALITLNEFPKYILYDLLRDFNITEEPFFRAMLRSNALVGLSEHYIYEFLKRFIINFQIALWTKCKSVSPHLKVV